MARASAGRVLIDALAWLSSVSANGEQIAVRLGWLVGAVAALVCLVLAGAYVGAYGPLVTCGADAAKVCVAWPAPVSGAVWVLFLVFFIGLTIWQVRAWRGSGSAVSTDKHIVEDG